MSTIFLTSLRIFSSFCLSKKFVNSSKINNSYGIEHKDSYELSAGDVVLVESGDYCKVVNDSDHDQLTYLRIFDRGGWRQ